MEKNNLNIPKWPEWDDEEKKILINALESGKWWAGAPGSHSGENYWNFQKEFAEFCEVKHAFAVTNGTHALEIALLALDIGLGDEVIVPDMTFFASASSVISTNAVPVFAEIREDTFNIDEKKIEHLITERTKAILVVHLGGMPASMEKICEIAKNRNLFIIEDCAHSHGSRYKGKRLGTWGNIGTFSFQASKVLTSGEGGAVITNDDELAEKIYGIIDCGRKIGQHCYDHYSYGSNYRLGEFQTALLRTQLKKFPQQDLKRNKNARYLTEKLNQIDGIKCQARNSNVEQCANYVFPFMFNPENFGEMNVNEFTSYLKSKGIPTDDAYPPLHSLRCFKETDLRKGIDYTHANWGREKSNDKNFPVTSRVFSRLIELPQEILLGDASLMDYIYEVISALQKSFTS